MSGAGIPDARGGSSLSPGSILPTVGTCTAGLYKQDPYLSYLHNKSCPQQKSAKLRQMRKRTQKTPLDFPFECPHGPGQSLCIASLVRLYLVGPSRGLVQRGLLQKKRLCDLQSEWERLVNAQFLSVPAGPHAPFPASHLCCPSPCAAPPTLLPPSPNWLGNQGPSDSPNFPSSPFFL